MRIILFILCLFVLLSLDVIANKSASPSDLILIHIVSIYNGQC